MQARTKGQATLIELPTGERYLVVEVTIDCPACGTQRLVVAGHHLRAIRDLMIDFIDQHPELAGPEADQRAIERTQIRGTVPPDPTRN